MPTLSPHAIIASICVILINLVLGLLFNPLHIGWLAVPLCLASGCDRNACIPMSVMGTLVLLTEIIAAHEQMGALSAGAQAVIIAGAAWPLTGLLSRRRSN